MSRVEVQPELFQWALQRSRRTIDDLDRRFPKLGDWMSGTLNPTMKQLQDFASVTASPLGYFFLPEPPSEPLPIPDYRTVTGSAVLNPSANLLDTLKIMRQRQEWLRETLIERESEPLGFVGSAAITDDPIGIAQEMRGIAGLDDEWADSVRSWSEAWRELRRRIEDIGIMAIVNGVVGNNTHRPLDVNEFRGFALCDEYAPLIFVNGADWESAKMFTLAHELAHVWIGQDALSGFDHLMPGRNDVETFCNTVAAEFLVPQRELKKIWPEIRNEDAPFEGLARRFKVNPIVCARRALDLHLISRERFFEFYESRYTEYQRKDKGKGGDFYNNQNTRIGQHFAKEVIHAAREGRLLYREAYKLTGLHGATFNKYASQLGFEVV